jgi:hypothetical protein
MLPFESASSFVTNSIFVDISLSICVVPLGSYLINLNGVFITLSICVASLKQKKFCGIFADFYDFSSPI